MANSTIGVNEGTNTKLDAESLTIGSDTVKRQRIQVAGDTSAQVADVVNEQPQGDTYGLVVRVSPQGVPVTWAAETAVVTTVGWTLVPAEVGYHQNVVWLSIACSATCAVYVYGGAMGSAPVLTFRTLANTTTFMAAPAGFSILRSVTGEPIRADVGTSCTVNWAARGYKSVN